MVKWKSSSEVTDPTTIMEQPEQKSALSSLPRKLCCFCFVYIPHLWLRTRWHQWSPLKPHWLRLTKHTHTTRRRGPAGGNRQKNKKKQEGNSQFLIPLTGPVQNQSPVIQQTSGRWHRYCHTYSQPILNLKSFKIKEKYQTSYISCTVSFTSPCLQLQFTSSKTCCDAPHFPFYCSSSGPCTITVNALSSHTCMSTM